MVRGRSSDELDWARPVSPSQQRRRDSLLQQESRVYARRRGVRVGRPYDATYYRELRALATGKRVAFLTDIDDANLVAAYQRAACVVLPSVYTSIYGRTTRFPELLGQTLLEGMACA